MGEEKSKCKYCGKEIIFGCIRCDGCDYAWQDGNKEGKKIMRGKFRETIGHFVNWYNEDIS